MNGPDKSGTAAAHHQHVVKSVEGQPGALPLLADLFTDLCGSACASVATAPSVCRTAARLSRSGRRCRSVPISSLRSTRTRWTPAVHAAFAHVPRQGELVRTRWERDAKQGADPAVEAEWALVEQLAGPDWRLIVTGEKDGKATAEVAHETLFKTWPTLKRWLEDERNFLV